MNKIIPKFFFKRTGDIIFSVVILVFFIPLWVIISLLVKITSQGPVFFKQNRPGKNGVIFQVIKFRTMKSGSDKMIRGQEVSLDDNRITSFGKFLRRTKIDEIPQILNILKGDMSLIGPRPERIQSLEYYDDFISKRLLMRPGITGLAQVSGNIYLDLSIRYKYDVYYVQNYSILLDFKIMFRTLFVIILGEKKYSNKPLVVLKSD